MITLSSPPPNLPHLECALAGTCSGCAWIRVPYATQAEQKIAALSNEWSRARVPTGPPPVRFRSIASGGLRDRADLILTRRSDGFMSMGLFAMEDRSVVDMNDCPQFSPSLGELLGRVRTVNLEVERGSIRLRVSPSGDFGVWLDFANIDVKRLLDERKSLDRLRAFATIEIGQKRKLLMEREGRLKLTEPCLKPWFETYLGDEARPTSVWTTIGGFTQPGFVANRALIDEARSAWRDVPRGRAAEFGSGSGNFTLPLAADGFDIDAYELDPLACDGLRLGLKTADMATRVRIHQGDFQRGKQRPPLEGLRMLFVDPPRSGLMGFLDPLVELPRAARPEHIVYVSCFAESFCRDAARLFELGYTTSQLALVDQFPQSPHFEIVSRFDLQ